jgi:hypothetical protein
MKSRQNGTETMICLLTAEEKNAFSKTNKIDLDSAFPKIPRILKENGPLNGAKELTIAEITCCPGKHKIKL